MSIYTQQDDGILVPIQVEQSIEDLLKTRDTVCVSSCSKTNLETLQPTVAPIEPVIVETTTKSTSSTSPGA